MEFCGPLPSFVLLDGMVLNSLHSGFLTAAYRNGPPDCFHTVEQVVFTCSGSCSF